MATESDRESDRIMVLDVLSAFVRESSGPDEIKANIFRYAPASEGGELIDMESKVSPCKPDITMIIDLFLREPTDFVHASYSLNLKGSYLCGFDRSGRQVAKTLLRRADFFKANLCKACLQWVDLQGVSLAGAYLREADLRWANLDGANLEGADLQNANLGGANLEDADLRGAKLWGANLQGARLQKADLRRVNLQSVKISKAQYDSAITDETTIPPRYIHA